MAATVRLDSLGVQFLLDRHRRPLTPMLARLRRPRTRAWGIHDIDLAFEPGDSVALIGPSGSGKTTLLRAIDGVLPADAGRVEVSGRVGCLLSTDAGLLPTLSGRENAALLAVLSGLPRTEVRARLERIGSRSGLGAAFERQASSLSAGMKARLGLATAWESAPEILLLDEVHEALDQEFRDRIFSWAEELTARGGIVIAAGQDLPLLGRMCRRGILLRSGTVRADGPFQQVEESYLRDE
jgi:ABC-type polysaccharide/polyol phosphate transport system ATPase subunit